MGEDWLANRNNSEIGALEDLMKSFFKTEKRELACEHCKDMDALATVNIYKLNICKYLAHAAYKLFPTMICMSTNIFQVSASISTLPDVLIIHMKRFIFNRE